jgi:putative heme-binding domain-containing protein
MRFLGTGVLLWLSAIFVLVGFDSRSAESTPESEKTALAVEALSRLEGVDVNSNPRLKETLLKVLQKTRGTADFVKLVQKFKLTDQGQGLLEIAIAQPASEAGVDAMRILLSSGAAAAINQTLLATNSGAATKLAEALGHTGDKQANQFLVPLMADQNRDLSLRKQAVRSLARTADGATLLLQQAREEKLPEDLKFTASAELNAVRWSEIQKEAAKILPPAQGHNSTPLPAIAELMKMKGDIVNGARIFTNSSPGCANCHVVNGKGIELGPNLSEIGVKLGKDALLESILEPSSGISFGYEAFKVYGLLASETADQVSVKGIGGIITRLKKSEIASRQQSKVSIMPSGLQSAMSVGELVDLIEYLASLKTASP